LEDRLHERESDFAQAQRQATELAKQLEQPFEHEQKLATASKRQQEIVSALDITKNRASARLSKDSKETIDTIHETGCNDAGRHVRCAA
jgi:uncharacterized protein (DUF1778 family)